MFNLEILKEIEKVKEVPVIVEGIKDKHPLLKLGFKNVFTISGQPLFSIVEKMKKMKEKTVIVLTDFDDEGRRKAKILSKLFEKNGIIVNKRIRRKIKSTFKVKKIEELKPFTKLIGDDYCEITTIYCKIFNRSRIFMQWNCGKTRCNRSNIRANRRAIRTRS